MPCFGFSKFPKLKLKLQKSYIVWIQCSGANFEQNVGWTQLSADHSSISSSFGLQQQHSKRNPRTKHEKLHYKKVINHATYINYHCWMGPWTFIKLFGVFGALAAPSALTLPWPHWGADCYIATRLLISFQHNKSFDLGVEIFWLKEP